MSEALPKSMEIDHEIRAVASHNGGADFLLMLRSGEIYEVTCDDSRIKTTSTFQYAKVRSSHYNVQKNKVSKLAGLAILHKSNGFITCSEDGKVMLWDCEDPTSSEIFNIDSRETNQKDQIEDMMTCIDIDMSDFFVAIGTSEGHIKIVDIESGMKKKDIATQEKVTALRFSPNKDFLAVGHWTGTLSIYLTQDWELMRHIKAYSSETTAIFCIDWTDDSNSIQTENKAREYKLWEVNGSYINEITTRSQGMNTKNWKTQSCLESWKVSGIVPSKYLLDESGIWRQAPKITGIVKTHSNPGYKGKDKLIVCYNDGTFEVGKYPCVGNMHEFVKMRSHFGPMIGCQFTNDNKYVITVGLLDNVINIWSLLDTEF